MKIWLMWLKLRLTPKRFFNYDSFDEGAYDEFEEMREQQSNR